jgi:hypothetical protein
MRTLTLAVMALASVAGVGAQEVDYGALWSKATPFHLFLEKVRAREEQWRSRFANAAVDAESLNQVRALDGRRRILAVAEDRCSDSAWAIPYVAKLAAAVPERLELRVINRREGGRIQAAHLTPDGRRATPTIVVLDEHDAVLGAWVERPAELQKWFIANEPALSSEELHTHMDTWYKKDAGQTTIREVLAIIKLGQAQ